MNNNRKYCSSILRITLVYHTTSVIWQCSEHDVNQDIIYMYVIIRFFCCRKAPTEHVCMHAVTAPPPSTTTSTSHAICCGASSRMVSNQTRKENTPWIMELRRVEEGIFGRIPYQVTGKVFIVPVVAWVLALLTGREERGSSLKRFHSSKTCPALIPSCLPPET